MILTLIGRQKLLSWALRGEAAPSNLYMALATAAATPDKDTVNLSELTQAATGNGYPDGGYQADLNSTDWDVLQTDSDDDYAEIQLKDIVFTVTGSPSQIPASGDGASWWVLTDDADGSPASTGNRTVLAYLAVSGAPVVALSGEQIKLIDARIRIGGFLDDTPTQWTDDGGPVTLTTGAGALGSYQELIASTSYRVTRVHLQIEHNSNDPLEFVIALGGAGSEVEKYRFRQPGTGGAPGSIRDVFIDIEIPAGSRVAIAGQNGAGGATVSAAGTFGGP